MGGLAAAGMTGDAVLAQEPPPPRGGPGAGEERPRFDGPPPGGKKRPPKGRAGRKTDEPRINVMHLRQRLNKLAGLPPDQLQQKLAQWPPYQQMDAAAREKLMDRIAKLRAKRRKEAMQSARKLGLVVPTDQQEAFVNRFWEVRLQREKRIWQEMQKLRRESQKRVEAAMLEEFGQYRTKPPPPNEGPAQKKPKDGP